MEQARVYYDLGEMHYNSSNGSISLAKENLNQSQQLLQIQKDTLLEAMLLNVLGLVNYELDSVSLAIENLQESIKTAQLINDSASIFDATINLSLIHQANEDYPSFGKVLENAESYLGSWSQKGDYDFYNRLSKDYLDYQKQKNKNYQRIKIALFSVLGLFIGFVFFNRYRNRQAQKMQLRIMQEYIDSFNFNYLEAKVEGERSERKKIAQDLHDKVGSQGSCYSVAV